MRKAKSKPKEKIKVINRRADGSIMKDPSEIIIGVTPGTERAARILFEMVKRAVEKEERQKE